MSDRVAGAIGLLPRAFEVGVSAASRATVRPPSPGTFAPGSSSHEPCRSLQRSSACRPPSACVSDLAALLACEKRLPWGLDPLHDISESRPHTPGAPTPPASVRPRRSSRPRRFPPRIALRVCFTPQPCPGFPYRGLSLRRSRSTRRRPVPSCRSNEPPAVARASSSPVAFRALLSDGVRWLRETVKNPGAPRPSWVSSPPGSRPRAVAAISRRLRLPPSSPRARSDGVPGVLPCPRLQARGTTRPTRSRFAA